MALPRRSAAADPAASRGATATDPRREHGRRAPRCAEPQGLAAVGLLLEEAFELATHGAVALAQRGEVVGDVGDVVGGDC